MGYISSFNTCSQVKSSLMHNPDPPKIMHERDFYIETYLEGDSAQSLAWRGPLIRTPNCSQSHSIRLRAWRSVAICGRHDILSFLQLDTIPHGLRTILKLRKARANWGKRSEGTLVILFFCCFYSRQCAHLSSSFLLATEVRGLDRRWVTGRKCR